jgi:hypothetical protein
MDDNSGVEVLLAEVTLDVSIASCVHHTPSLNTLTFVTDIVHDMP